MKSLINTIPRLAAGAVLLSAFVCRANAQIDNRGEGRSVCENAVGKERRRCESEIATVEKPPPTLWSFGQPDPFGEFRLPLAQIAEDLRHLRDATDHLSQAASQSSELDFRSVAKLASEVKNRAARLREGLALPSAEKHVERGKEKVPLDTAQLKEALSTLSALISGAVRNPILRGYVLDMPRSARARDDLEEIIRLSEHIRMSSKVIDKSRQ